MNALQQAEKVLRDRLRELEHERGRLEKALNRLVDENRPGSRKPRTAGRRKRAPGKRAKPGQRQEQLLAESKTNPGSRPSELAKSLGISSNQVHGLLRKAQREKLVTKRAGKYSLKS
jgi:hypothetical protein